MGLFASEKLQKEFDWSSPGSVESGAHFGGG
jgi:hypothetical protein